MIELTPPKTNGSAHTSNGFSETVSLIWSVADLLRGDYRQSEYGRVILPFLVLRRLDQVLAPTRKAVLAADANFPADKTPEALRERMLLNASGETFYNTSKLDFGALLEDPENVAANLTGYVHGFSKSVRDIMENFSFEEQVARLDGANILFLVLRKFGEIDLDRARRRPDGSLETETNGDPIPHITDGEMGDLFDEMLRRYAEQSGETSGEHLTPADVRRLMVALLLAGETEPTSDAAEGRTVYDPACGTGGLLTATVEQVRKIAPSTRVNVSGQEINGEVHAICASSLLVRGLDPSGVSLGNCLANDGHPDVRADYILSTPPFGLDWSRVEDAVRTEHEQRGHAGRFGPGLPRKSDSSLLFLLHMLSKMKPLEQGGSRVAVLTNGSPLFSGAAGTGESEIRRWIIENDWLEAVVALPDGILYNTSIPTYIWVLTNRKDPSHKGTVRLVNGGDYFRGIHRSLGSKRREFSDDNIQAVVALLGVRGDPDVLILRNEDLGYQRLSLSRPLRLNFQASEERIARFQDDPSWQSVLKGEKGQAETDAGRTLQQSVLGVLKALDGTKLFTARPEFVKALKAEANSHGVSIPAAIQKTILSALSQRDETAEVCERNGEPEFDPDFRRVVEVALNTDVDDYLERQVRPELPDAGVDNVQIGFAVRRVAHLGFGLRRELERLRNQYEGCQLLPLHQLCLHISRRPRSGLRASPDIKLKPLEAITSLRFLKVETDETVLLSAYLAMFLSTEIGEKLLHQLAAGTGVMHIDPNDFGQLEVPVPTLDQQRSLLSAKASIDELAQLLSRVEGELAANPANVGVVHDTVGPILKALGQLSEADEVRELVRRGESKRVEFKETLSLDVRKQTKESYIEESALKNVVAFLNSEGGDLLVGVADDGQIKGVEPELAKFHKGSTDKLLLHVKNLIKARIGEQFYPLMDQHVVTVDGASVLWVRCDTSESPVYLDDKSFYVRTNPATDKLEGRKQYEYIKRRFGLGGHQ